MCDFWFDHWPTVLIVVREIVKSVGGLAQRSKSIYIIWRIQDLKNVALPKPDCERVVVIYPANFGEKAYSGPVRHEKWFNFVWTGKCFWGSHCKIEPPTEVACSVFDSRDSLTGYRVSVYQAYVSNALQALGFGSVLDRLHKPYQCCDSRSGPPRESWLWAHVCIVVACKSSKN